MKNNKMCLIVLLSIIIILVCGPISYAKTAAQLAEEKQVMDRELSLREAEKHREIQVPRCLNPNLARIKMNPKLASKIDPYDDSSVPTLHAIRIDRLFNEGYKNRVALPPIVSDLKDGGKAAILSMLSVVLSKYVEPEEATKLMNNLGKANSDPELLCKALNKIAFGKTEVKDKYSEGYRVAIYHDRNKKPQPFYCNAGYDKDFALLFRRIKRNIDDGYPIIARVDRSVLYKDKKGFSYIIITGYLESPDDKSIGAIYFVDPASDVQDPVWDGLKYSDYFTQVFSAIARSDYQIYIW